jgi:membrane protein
VPTARLLARLAREQSSERVGLAASGAAFWLVISALPTAIAVVSLYGLFVTPERVADDLGRLANDLPGSFGSLLAEQVHHVAASSPAGLSIGLVGSLAVALWSASTGIYQLDSAIRDAYGLAPQRFVEARLRALAGALVTVVLLGLIAVVTPVALTRHPLAIALLALPVALVGLTVAVGAMYRFSVGVPLGVRAVLPGAVTSAVGVVLVSVGFGAYVATSGRYAAVYGAFAGAVIGMLAIYLAVRVVLLGAVLNSELDDGRLLTDPADPPRRRPVPPGRTAG